VTSEDVSGAEKPSQAISRKARRLVAELGSLRLLATLAMLALAMLVARYSWHIILLGDAERALYDLRTTYLAPKVEQDPRIIKVVYNDDTLIDTRKRSPLDRAMLARALTNIDAMGAKAVGIDILIDQPQDEDEELLAALRAMKTPTYLAYADTQTNTNNIQARQQAFLDSFMTQLGGSNSKPASIRLEVDIDNVVRSWPQVQQGLPPILSRSLVPDDLRFQDYQGSIAYRVGKYEDRPLFASLPIDLVANTELAPALAEQLKGRYVLIGGDIVDVDEFETPLRLLTAKPMIGLDVHAHMLAQLLDGKRLSPTPRWASWTLAILVVIAGGLTSLQNSGMRMAFFVALQVVFFGSLAFIVQSSGVDTQNLPTFGWLIGWAMALVAIGMAVREIDSQQRRFAQGALGKYLPRDIAQEILDQPDRLALHGEKREIFVVFSDLEGFTSMSHQIEPEMVATLLNSYLDALCSVILKYGGTIDKFVGDATVSFWGAPISRPDDGERAAKAAYELWQAGEAFRKAAPLGVPPIGMTRVGLHFGEAVIGNFGGEGRIQYTALGDSMNTASRLESANKQTKTGVLASSEAVERSALDWWRPLGSVQLRGRAMPVDIFEPRPDISEVERNTLAALLARLGDDRAVVIAELEATVLSNPDDSALANLLYRIKNAHPGGYYALD
jgi:adenylate cyclase